jgi:protocatechuate 3,4-dioxygenase beta subunit
VTREGFDAQPFNASKPNGYRKWPLAGPEFTHVCLPDFKVSGRVIDEGGKPLRGVLVDGHQGIWPVPGTPTDAEGRFEFTGLPRGEEIVIEFEPRDETLLPRRVGVTARIDESEKTLDVVLKQGIRVSGRVTDAATGQPVGGCGIRFCPLVDNKYAEQPGYDAFYRSHLRHHISDDGNYSFSVIPGPGLLMLQAQGEGVKIGDQNLSIYRRARFSAEDLPHIKLTGDGDGRFLEVGQSLGSIGVEQVVKYVNFAPGTQPQRIDLQLQRGKTVDVEFVDASGQPVTDLFISGITETWPITAKLKDSRCTIYALGADRPRSVFLVHAQRSLAGALTLTGDEKSPVRVTLAKSASLRGRAVDTEGAPLANRELTVHLEDQSARELYRFLPEQKSDLLTDATGRFEMKHLVPGQRYTIHNMGVGDEYLEARLSADQRTPAPGQEFDLGNVIFAPQ